MRLNVQWYKYLLRTKTSMLLKVLQFKVYTIAEGICCQRLNGSLTDTQIVEWPVLSIEIIAFATDAFCRSGYNYNWISKVVNSDTILIIILNYSLSKSQVLKLSNTATQFVLFYWPLNFIIYLVVFGDREKYPDKFKTYSARARPYPDQ